MIAIKGISSMATRRLLVELAADWQARGGEPLAIEAVGGVDAVKRVQAGEAFDVVFLAADVIDQLIAAGHLLPGSRVDLVHSGVAVAVRAGAPHPDIGSEDALRRAVLAAPGVGYSTGPSGVALCRLFERWGVADQVMPRAVQARPGVPVAALLAEGKATLGFQQLAEMIGEPGIDVLGPLPPEIQITTTFSAGVTRGSPKAETVRKLLEFLASPEAAPAKRRQGMQPA